MKRRNFIASMAVVTLPSVRADHSVPIYEYDMDTGEKRLIETISQAEAQRRYCRVGQPRLWLNWECDGAVDKCAQYQLGTEFTEKEIQQTIEYFSGTK